MISASKSAFRYFVFGLTVESEFKLPGVPHSDAEPQVFFRVGDVPSVLAGATNESVVVDVCPGTCLFKIPQAARFLITDGVEVIIDPSPASCVDTIRAFLLGPVFGILLHQLNFLPIHGSAIQAGGEAIAFIGPTGAGKSTLAAAFLQRGYQVLADEICAVLPAEKPFLLAGPPWLAVWEDALSQLAIGNSDLLPVRPHLRKFLLPAQQISPPAPVRLARCYVLNTPGCATEYSIESLKGIAKVKALASHTYRRSLLEAPGRNATNFEQICRIATSMKVKLVRRAAAGFTAVKLADALERDFSV